MARAISGCRVNVPVAGQLARQSDLPFEFDETGGSETDLWPTCCEASLARIIRLTIRSICSVTL